MKLSFDVQEELSKCKTSGRYFREKWFVKADA